MWTFNPKYNTIPAVPILVHHFLLAQNTAAVQADIRQNAFQWELAFGKPQHNLALNWRDFFLCGSANLVSRWLKTAHNVGGFLSIWWNIESFKFMNMQIDLPWICFELQMSHGLPHLLEPELLKLWYQRNVHPASQPAKLPDFNITNFLGWNHWTCT